MDTFSVSIQLTIAKDGPDGGPYFSSNNDWNAMDYEGVVTVEQVMVDALDKLVEVGYLEAVKKGTSTLEEARAARDVVKGKS